MKEYKGREYKSSVDGALDHETLIRKIHNEFSQLILEFDTFMFPMKYSSRDMDQIEKWKYNTIVQANNKLQTPPKTTKLGGGIGIHGWVASDWANDDDRHLTWGCISMHNDDLKLFFEQIKLNAPIYILP